MPGIAGEETVINRHGMILRIDGAAAADHFVGVPPGRIAAKDAVLDQQMSVLPLAWRRGIGKVNRTAVARRRVALEARPGHQPVEDVLAEERRTVRRGVVQELAGRNCELMDGRQVEDGALEARERDAAHRQVGHVRSRREAAAKVAQRQQRSLVGSRADECHVLDARQVDHCGNRKSPAANS